MVNFGYHNTIMHLKYSDIIYWKCNECWLVELIPDQVSIQDLKSNVACSQTA